MAASTGTVRIVGLKELSRDLRAISKDMSKSLQSELKKAAEPVGKAAEELALGRIRNMPASPEWAGMRIGASRASGTVYVVPSRRRRGARARSPRIAATFMNLMLERAMDPAVQAKQDEVVRNIENLLDRLGDRHGF